MYRRIKTLVTHRASNQGYITSPEASKLYGALSYQLSRRGRYKNVVKRSVMINLEPLADL